ncbi:MAG: DUF2470 domain-containing protein [Pseudomonadota bacterium]
MTQEPPKSVLRDVDDDARRLAKSLIRTARFGALGVKEPGTGIPLVSRVSLATDLDGAPIILISQLSAHFGALEADGTCSLLMGEPGKGDPLAHPRITVICSAEKSTGDLRAALRDRFLRRHPKAALYADFGDFAFWRLVPQRASLNGGFGKAFEMEAQDLSTDTGPDWRALEPGAVAHMIEDHQDAIDLYASEAGLGAGPWTLTGLDADGMDLICADTTGRVWFEPPLESTEALRPRLVALAKRARKNTST